MSTTHDCGHEVEYMDVACMGGWSRVPMRCLECFGDCIDLGLCCECGDAAAPGCEHTSKSWKGGEKEPTLTVFRYCRTHWLDAIRPEKCEVCGRFVGADGDCVEVGERPGYYDPYWSHMPAEPIFEWRCKLHLPEAK